MRDAGTGANQMANDKGRYRLDRTGPAQAIRCVNIFRKMTADDDQDRGLTEQEAQLVAGLPPELVTRIDDALLAKATRRFRKVARIVGEVMQSFSDRPLGIPDVYYAQRVAKLVNAGLLESQGNPLRMRFSEVRLPSTNLSVRELEDLIAQRQYNRLGQLYEDGQGVPRDYMEALKWYRIAADQGDIWAQSAVGRFYQKGYGVRQDDEEACFWFSLAASRSPDKVHFAIWRDETLGKLTQEQKEEVQKRLQVRRP